MSYKASVIVPVFNAEKTLRRCAESIILGQERDIEVILVDDCSKDRSWELCLELAQEFSNITTVQNERNSGVSFTRNRGLELAQGDYVMFVDSDDWVSERYARVLLRLAEDYPDALPICGLHFIDHVHGHTRNYTWSNAPEEVNIIPARQFFDLTGKVLLQSPCNKIFLRSVIEGGHLHFDETQSMGEDFQFVLDYLESAKIQQCVTVNAPLYYYIRWNETSLMSHFGLLQNTQEYQRIEQLYQLSGLDDPTVLRDQLHQIKRNYLYHIARNRQLSKTEKLRYMECVMGDGCSRRYYRQQKVLQGKEKLTRCFSALKKFPKRIRGRLLWLKRGNTIRCICATVKTHDVTLISQNCIGGVFYHDLGTQFLSPTINLFIKEPDFVRFVLNLRHYIDCELEMRWEEEYPVGRLDDIEIHFMHYKTCQEAKEQWDRRKKRINWEKIVVLCTDRDGFNETAFQQWKYIPYPKVLFTAQQSFSRDKDSVFFPQYSEQGCVPDLIPNREFYHSEKVVNVINMIDN